MSRAFDDDSGVLALSELPPQFVDPSMTDQPAGAPYWGAPPSRSSFPPAQSAPAWSSYGQWSQPPVSAPQYGADYQRTDRYPRLNMPMKARPRWGMRFFLVACVAGAGGAAYLGRSHLPQVPRNAIEASAAWDNVVSNVRRTGVLGADATTLAPSVPMDSLPANAGRTMRRPEIVPMPSLMPERLRSRPIATAIAPASALPRARPEFDAASAHASVHPAQQQRMPAPALTPKVRTPSPRPLHVASAAPAPAAAKKAAVDPFDDGTRADDRHAEVARPARAEKAERAEKVHAVEVASAPAREPAPREVSAPRETAAPARPRAEPKPVPGSLDDLMSSSLKKPTRARSEIDKKLTGIDESREEEVAARKRTEAQAAAVHSLTRSEIQDAMHGVQLKVGDCYQQYQEGGPVDLKINVGESGRVSAATVTGKFAGTPSGTCVERAVKHAEFPASGGLHFDYRVTLR